MPKVNFNKMLIAPADFRGGDFHFVPLPQVQFGEESCGLCVGPQKIVLKAGPGDQRRLIFICYSPRFLLN